MKPLINPNVLSFPKNINSGSVKQNLKQKFLLNCIIASVLAAVFVRSHIISNP